LVSIYVVHIIEPPYESYDTIIKWYLLDTYLSQRWQWLVGRNTKEKKRKAWNGEGKEEKIVGESRQWHGGTPK
jgi:hypothetical protein